MVLCLQPKDADAAKPLLEPIPDMEWWDVRICADGASYDAMAAAASEDQFLLRDKITNLVGPSSTPPMQIAHALLMDELHGVQQSWRMMVSDVCTELQCRSSTQCP